jgi:hypothetical protein
MDWIAVAGMGSAFPAIVAYAGPACIVQLCRGDANRRFDIYLITARNFEIRSAPAIRCTK